MYIYIYTHDVATYISCGNDKHVATPTVMKKHRRRQEQLPQSHSALASDVAKLLEQRKARIFAFGDVRGFRVSCVICRVVSVLGI